MSTRVIAYLNPPIDTAMLAQLIIGLTDCVVDVDDGENIVIREKGTGE